MGKLLKAYFWNLLIPWISILFATIACIYEKEKVFGRKALPPHVETYNNMCSLVWILVISTGSLLNYHFQEWRRYQPKRRI